MGNEKVIIETKSLEQVIGDKFAAARRFRGYTQAILAEKIDMAQADISSVENGQRNPSVSTLRRIAEGLNMDLMLELMPRELRAGGGKKKK